MVRSMHRFFLMAVTALVPLSALADRYVVINGQRLSEAQIESLERQLGGYIRNGVYWFNPYTGASGYVGNPWPMGYISGRHRSLSERRRLYRPGEILSE